MSAGYYQEYPFDWDRACMTRPTIRLSLHIKSVLAEVNRDSTRHFGSWWHCCHWLLSKSPYNIVYKQENPPASPYGQVQFGLLCVRLHRNSALSTRMCWRNMTQDFYYLPWLTTTLHYIAQRKDTFTCHKKERSRWKEFYTCQKHEKHEKSTQKKVHRQYDNSMLSRVLKEAFCLFYQSRTSFQTPLISMWL